MFVVISYIFSVLTVRWYSRRFTLKKEQAVETSAPATNNKVDSESDTGSEKEQTKADKAAVKQVFNQ